MNINQPEGAAPINKGAKALAEYQRKVKAGEIEVAKPEFNPMKRLASDPNSRIKAFKAMCFHCMGGDPINMADGGWKEEVRSCTAWPPCPIHDFRPYKVKVGEETYATKVERWVEQQTNKAAV